MNDWHDIVEGPAVVAERDQFEAELRDVISDARLLFVVAAPNRPGGPEIIVRGLYALPSVVGSSERLEDAMSFLAIARLELERMIGDLEARL